MLFPIILGLVKGSDVVSPALKVGHVVPSVDCFVLVEPQVNFVLVVAAVEGLHGQGEAQGVLSCVLRSILVGVKGIGVFEHLSREVVGLVLEHLGLKNVPDFLGMVDLTAALVDEANEVEVSLHAVVGDAHLAFVFGWQIRVSVGDGSRPECDTISEVVALLDVDGRDQLAKDHGQEHEEEYLICSADDVALLPPDESSEPPNECTEIVFI
mmetsp:Transcript_12059/g.18610  ORF Transcript_12059/g.18610 Transcript_12059/m.18610 type:complete len:211 (-) Transcript_12059:18-650(-)